MIMLMFRDYPTRFIIRYSLKGLAHQTNGTSEYDHVSAYYISQILQLQEFLSVLSASPSHKAIVKPTHY